MKMSSLVDSTYRSLVSRLQRAGTAVKAVSRPTADKYRWGFSVTGSGAELSVSVELMTVNVYKNDKVQIAVAGIMGVAPSRTFTPISGNCPPLDAVEAFIRFALEEKGDTGRKTCSSKGEPAKPKAFVEPPPVQAEPSKKSKKHRKGGHFGPDSDPQERPVEPAFEPPPEAIAEPESAPE